jgi:hypothetical protein
MGAKPSFEQSEGFFGVGFRMYIDFSTALSLKKTGVDI